VVGREEYEVVVFADFAVERVKQVRDVEIDPEVGVFDLDGPRAVVVPDYVCR
jgi:hypothetical protein